MTADAIGGVWTYSLELARALAPHGVAVTLATMGRLLTADERRESRSVPGLTVEESELRLEWMDDPWEDQARAGEWLLELEARVRPDLVHLNGYSLGALPWRAPVLVAGHSCVLSWWRAVKGTEAPPSWDRYREAVRRGLRASGAVVAPSRAMLAELAYDHGPLPALSTVVPNGRTGSFVLPGRKEPFVLSAGRLWDEAKNLAALERAAFGLPWQVCVAGESRADRPSTGSANLRSLGPLPPHRLAAWMARAAVYALPALYEPFGLTVLEAGLAGCALVLGDIPSLRENWDGAAEFVDPGDSDALAAALRRLCAGVPSRRALGEKARARALTFMPGRMARGYLGLYARLLAVAPSSLEENACAS
jgi:glycosyltransferase involved in cell wall biosynthesis